MIMLRDCKYGDTSLISAHFKVCEFQCKCKGKHSFQIDTVLIDKLEQLREKLNCSAINISSGFRCLAHDKAVGGSGTGQTRPADTAFRTETAGAEALIQRAERA